MKVTDSFKLARISQEFQRARHLYNLHEWEQVDKFCPWPGQEKYSDWPGPPDRREFLQDPGCQKVTNLQITPLRKSMAVTVATRRPDESFLDAEWCVDGESPKRINYQIVGPEERLYIWEANEKYPIARYYYNSHNDGLFDDKTHARRVGRGYLFERVPC